MTMVRKSKVEKSPHFEEIVTRLSEGQSARSVSKWLENEYGEYISNAALSRYVRNTISMEDKVEAELNRRAEEKRKKLQEEKEKLQEEKEKLQKEKKVQQEADKIEAAEEKVNTVAETIADNMSKVAEVAANFIDDYERAKSEAEDPEITKVTYKDVANLSLQANKFYAEYFKQDAPNIEVKDVKINLLEKVKEKRRELNDLSNGRKPGDSSMD